VRAPVRSIVEPRRAAVAVGVALAALSVVGMAACSGGDDQSAPTSVAPMAADELCRAVPAEAVAAAVGAAWPRVDDPAGGCRYQSDVAPTAAVTISSTTLDADDWKAQVARAGGQLVPRGDVLVADYGGDGFGPLDEVWWVGPGGRFLIMRVDDGVSEEQALSIVDFARHGSPSATGGTGGPEGTSGAGTTVAPPVTRG
jgi:hypothetical protein